MEKMLLDWSNMDNYTEIPIGYRFVDKVEVIPGKEAVGTKAVSSLDWYFKIHFPGNPIMPGVFLMEAMQQTGLFIITTLPDIKEKIMLFQSCKNMRMFKSVRPGDVIKTCVVLKSFRCGVANFEGSIHIQNGNDDILICSMTFTQIIQSQLPQIKAPMIETAMDSVFLNGGVFDWKNIEHFLANTGEFRFVDKVWAVPSRYAAGIKLASSQDWYFNVHYPGNPIMPSGVMIEAMMQTGVFTITTMPEKPQKLMLFHGCESVEFYDFIRPGDTVLTETELISYKHGVARIKGVIRKNNRHEGVVGILTCTLISPDRIVRLPES